MGTTTHKSHSFKIHPDGASAVIVPDISSMGLQVNGKISAELTAAAFSPAHAAINEIKPVFSLNSFAIATLLDTVGVAGLCITATSNAGAVGYWQRYKQCGTPDASGHRSFQFKSGILVPKTLTCDHRGDAQLTCELIPCKVSGSDIIITSDSATLPSIAIASARWTLGPIQINGVPLADYNRLEIDFGNNVEAAGTGSDIYDSRIAVRTHSPTIKIRGIDPTWFGSAGVPLGGAAVTASADYIFLRKRSRGEGGFVADATAEHIQFVPAGVATHGQGLSGEAQRVGETELMLTLATDASGNSPIAIDTTAAIA